MLLCYTVPDINVFVCGENVSFGGQTGLYIASILFVGCVCITHSMGNNSGHVVSAPLSGVWFVFFFFFSNLAGNHQDVHYIFPPTSLETGAAV